MSWGLAHSPGSQKEHLTFVLGLVSANASTCRFIAVCGKLRAMAP